MNEMYPCINRNARPSNNQLITYCECVSCLQRIHTIPCRYTYNIITNHWHSSHDIWEKRLTLSKWKFTFISWTLCWTLGSSCSSISLLLLPVRETETRTGLRATATAAVNREIPTRGAISRASGLMPPPPVIWSCSWKVFFY